MQPPVPRTDWAWWAAIVVLGTALLTGLAMLAAIWPPPRQPAWGFIGFEGILGVSNGLMGALVVRRRPGNVVGWLMLVDGTLSAIQFVVDLAPSVAIANGLEGGPAEVWASWLANLIWIPGVALIGLLFLVFPDGSPPSPRWRWAARILAAGTLGLVVTQATAPGALQNFPEIQNPFGVGGEIAAAALNPAYGLYLVGLLAGAVALVARWRGAPPVARAQIKWLAFVGLPFVVAVVLSIGIPFFSYVAIGLGALIPAAIAVAILRYRLYDIDQLISRTVLYGSLTAVLAALYTASIRLSTVVFTEITGSTSDAPVIFSTLILAAAFSPVRKSLEKAVERRFKPSAATAEGSVLPVGSISVAELKLIVREVMREELAAARDQATLAESATTPTANSSQTGPRG